MNTYVDRSLKFIFPGKCFDELFVKWNVFHPTCPGIVLSRLLGLAITAGSLMLFIPQIVKIFNAKSAKGISLCSQLLALVASASLAAYSYSKGFVFSQWGDSLFVSIQLVIIVMQIFYYSSNPAYAFAFFSLCWAMSFAVVGDYVPMQVLTGLQALGIPITFISKGIQAYENWKSKGTGQLSLISVFLQMAGTAARVFTSIQETGDMLLISGFVLAAVMNAIIFAQFFIYWSAPADQKKKKKQ